MRLAHLFARRLRFESILQLRHRGRVIGKQNALGGSGQWIWQVRHRLLGRSLPATISAIETAMIPSPIKDEAYDNRDTVGELVVDEAALVGWTRSEAMAAIVDVALNQKFVEDEIERTNFRLVMRQRMVEH